ncbi:MULTISPECIES: hypothetical protein [Streptomycetaceae]|uniref:hypothetical protein n=1 Tax=Streptomycetaceae TaxID=2062 RepID=UPI00035EE47B|nr:MULTISPECIES: hypothetical protein [Streptomycetaceae]MDX2850191.1 hypothetical protein [Streptomyces sp. PA03-3a]MYX37613.1 hypothetical protein [Streptomyces sp. SID8377]
MKGFLGFLGFVLLSQGIGGIAYQLTGGWFRVWALTHRIGFLDGYEIYVCVLLIVLGIAVCSAAESVGKRA